MLVGGCCFTYLPLPTYPTTTYLPYHYLPIYQNFQVHQPPTHTPTYPTIIPTHGYQPTYHYPPTYLPAHPATHSPTYLPLHTYGPTYAPTCTATYLRTHQPPHLPTIHYLLTHQPRKNNEYWLPIGLMGQVWYLIVSISDLCTLTSSTNLPYYIISLPVYPPTHVSYYMKTRKKVYIGFEMIIIRGKCLMVAQFI